MPRFIKKLEVSEGVFNQLLWETLLMPGTEQGPLYPRENKTDRIMLYTGDEEITRLLRTGSSKLSELAEVHVSRCRKIGGWASAVSSLHSTIPIKFGK